MSIEKKCIVCGKSIYLRPSRAKAGEGKFCSKRCRYSERATKMRFWERVDKNGPMQQRLGSRCWEWTHGKGGDGYGVFTVGGSSQLAHRVSYSYSKMNILNNPNAFVLHHCDNRLCVNPDHLYIGTYLNNARDREDRNPGHQAKGSKNGKSKLTRAQVKEMRRLYADGQLNQVQLADRYQITQGHVSAILRGAVWGWL